MRCLDGLRRFFSLSHRCEFADRCNHYNPDAKSNCQVDGAYWEKPFCGLHKRFLRGEVE
jgi:hypothetical protein